MLFPLRLEPWLYDNTDFSSTSFSLLQAQDFFISNYGGWKSNPASLLSYLTKLFELNRLHSVEHHGKTTEMLSIWRTEAYFKVLS
jgi:hypothetical protein